MNRDKRKMNGEKIQRQQEMSAVKTNGWHVSLWHFSKDVRKWSASGEAEKKITLNSANGREKANNRRRLIWMKIGRFSRRLPPHIALMKAVIEMYETRFLVFLHVVDCIGLCCLLLMCFQILKCRRIVRLESTGILFGTWGNVISCDTKCRLWSTKQQEATTVDLRCHNS